MIDGPAFLIAFQTAYQPDGLVYRGPRPPPDAREVPSPPVVVELLSASTAARDTTRKMIGYVSRPSVHDLILDSEARAAIHFKRGLLLLHDRVAWTARMLPTFLAELKTRGYKIVDIVARAGTGETSPAPAGWVSETGRTLTAIEPRLDAGTAPRAAAPIEVKPAPME